MYLTIELSAVDFYVTQRTSNQFNRPISTFLSEIVKNIELMVIVILSYLLPYVSRNKIENRFFF